jgi:hypothetical protein
VVEYEILKMIFCLLFVFVVCCLSCFLGVCWLAACFFAVWLGLGAAVLFYCGVAGLLMVFSLFLAWLGLGVRLFAIFCLPCCNLYRYILSCFDFNNIFCFQKKKIIYVPCRLRLFVEEKCYHQTL